MPVLTTTPESKVAENSESILDPKTHAAEVDFPEADFQKKATFFMMIHSIIADQPTQTGTIVRKAVRFQE